MDAVRVLPRVRRTVSSLRPEILDHYTRVAHEGSRLDTVRGQLEFERSKELIRRFVPRRRSVIYDIGGGPGTYASWLARLGHEVHLVDPVPLHVRQARSNAAGHPRAAPAEILLGDARARALPERSADVVLLMGPLYHLPDAAGRRKALREARRVLVPGGRLLAVGVSRFTSMLDGSWNGYLSDPEFARIVRRDLRTGEHRNPNNVPAYWTTSYFALPDQLEDEIRRAGFSVQGTFAVEGFVWWVPDLPRKWRDVAFRGHLLRWLRKTELEPALLGMGPHFLCVATKPVAR